MASLLPYNGVLGHRLAKHLLRRASYHHSKIVIDTMAVKTAEQAVEDLFDIPDHTVSEPIDPENLQHFINQGVEPISSNFLLRPYIIGWWIEEAMQDTSIAHKLEFFLHSIFVTNADSGDARQFYDYLHLFRLTSTRFTNGDLEMDSYKNLALKMITDNLMLRYLNGNQNTRFAPNENFAREFFELFTIGKGPQVGPGDYTNYTEADIIEAAKVLTGWVHRNRPLGAGGDPEYTDPVTGIQRGWARVYPHDKTDKVFSAAFNNTTITGGQDEEGMWQELQDFVDMIFAQQATAKTICRRLYRYFVSSNLSEEIESDIITPLAQTLFDNDYKLSVAIKQLLKSQHFYDLDDSSSTDEIIGNIVKSPAEKLMQTMTFFNISTPDYLADAENHYDRWYRRTFIKIITTQAGMPIFFPDSVAGYPAYYQEPSFARNWFNGATLIPRYKQAEILLTGNRVLDWGDNGGVSFNIVEFIAGTDVVDDPSNAESVVNDLIHYLFAEPPSSERASYFLAIFLDDLSPINWYFEWLNYENTGDDSAVKIPLETLFKALTASQEYCLM